MKNLKSKTVSPSLLQGTISSLGTSLSKDITSLIDNQSNADQEFKMLSLVSIFECTEEKIIIDNVNEDKMIIVM